MPNTLRHSAAALVTASLAFLLPGLAQAETRVVPRGGSLQAALNAAVPGDEIHLEAGAEYLGNFVLPVKSGTAPIVVRTAPSSALPPAGQRIRPQHVSALARLRSPNTMSVLRTAPGAHHWELRYLEFAGNQGGYGDILQLGDGSSAQNSLSRVPYNLVLSHLLIHGDPEIGQKRCIALNAAQVSIRDSHIAECKGVAMDTQAIAGWNGPGPFVIENNYVEGAGENVMFGGSDPAIPNLVPDGIVIRHNHFSRPIAWRDAIVATPHSVSASAGGGGSLGAGTYGYRIVARRAVTQGAIARSAASAQASVTVGAGGAVHLSWQAVPEATDYRVYGRTPGGQSMYWTVTTTTFTDAGVLGSAGAVPTDGGSVWSVKNLLELKNARNVTIEENIFDNHWQEAQAGYAIVFTPRNSGGTCTWCVVEHVRFESNVVRRVPAGINLLGYDVASRPTRQSNDFVIRNNLFYDIGETFAGNGWVFLIGNEPRDIVIDHNTISHGGTSVIYLYGGTSSNPREIYGVRITNNAARHRTYGINGDFFPYGSGVISRFLPGAVVIGNYLAGGDAARYPAGNRFSGPFEAEFVDAANGDFRLSPSSQLRNTATDGADIGADIGNLLYGVNGVDHGSTTALSSPKNLRIVKP